MPQLFSYQGVGPATRVSPAARPADARETAVTIDPEAGLIGGPRCGNQAAPGRIGRIATHTTERGVVATARVAEGRDSDMHQP